MRAEISSALLLERGVRDKSAGNNVHATSPLASDDRKTWHCLNTAAKSMTDVGVIVKVIRG